MVLLNLVVNGVTLMFAVVSAVTGAFGMNLNAWMPQETKQSAVRHAHTPYACRVNSAAMQPCADAGCRSYVATTIVHLCMMHLHTNQPRRIC